MRHEQKQNKQNNDFINKDIRRLVEAVCNKSTRVFCGFTMF